MPRILTCSALSVPPVQTPWARHPEVARGLCVNASISRARELDTLERRGTNGHSRPAARGGPAKSEGSAGGRPGDGSALGTAGLTASRRLAPVPRTATLASSCTLSAYRPFGDPGSLGWGHLESRGSVWTCRCARESASVQPTPLHHGPSLSELVHATCWLGRHGVPMLLRVEARYVSARRRPRSPNTRCLDKPHWRRSGTAVSFFCRRTRRRSGS